MCVHVFAGSVGAWLIFNDPESQCCFYWNKDENVCTWDAPTDVSVIWDSPPEPVSLYGHSNPLAKGALGGTLFILLCVYAFNCLDCSIAVAQPLRLNAVGHIRL